MYTKLNASGSGDHILVEGEAGKTVKISAIFFQATATSTVKLKSGGNDLTGSMGFGIGGGINLPSIGATLFECGDGEDFIVNLSALSNIGGAFIYEQS